VTLSELKLKAVLEASRQMGQTTYGVNGFTEVQRQKRHANKDITHSPKKATTAAKTPNASESHKEFPIRNFSFPSIQPPWTRKLLTCSPPNLKKKHLEKQGGSPQ
jgi:hypothetical protein